MFPIFLYMLKCVACVCNYIGIVSHFLTNVLFHRFLGFNTFSAYQRAKYSAVKILGRHFARDHGGSVSGMAPPGASASVATISSEVSVDMHATGVPKLPEATI